MARRQATNEPSDRFDGQTEQQTNGGAREHRSKNQETAKRTNNQSANQPVMATAQVEQLQNLHEDVMEGETVFVLAIFSVFFAVGASLFYYACCVTDNEEAGKKIRESLKRRRSSVKISMTAMSQFPHTIVPVRETHSVGIQVVPPAPEVVEPPSEFSEGSSSNRTPIRTPTPERTEEHRNSIDCSNHSNVLSLLLQEYLDSFAKAKENASNHSNNSSGSSTGGSPKVFHL